MKVNYRIVLVISACWSAFWAAIHLKNYFQAGHFFMIVQGDQWDAFFSALSSPGDVAAALITIPFWGIHDYPYYLTVEILPLAFNCSFYSVIALGTARILRFQAAK